ncbi:MAG: flagellar hook-length control protein FliK, partial [Pyrinomonadaceae bacterium]
MSFKTSATAVPAEGAAVAPGGSDEGEAARAGDSAGAVAGRAETGSASWHPETLTDPSREMSSAAGMLSLAARRIRTAPSAAAARPVATAEDAAGPARNETLSSTSDNTMTATTQAAGQTSVEGAASFSGVEPAAFAGQTARTIMEMAAGINRRETRMIRLSLRPEELGRVEVRVTRDRDGNLSAHLIAEQDSTQRALAAGIGALRESLERAGLSFDRLDVSTNVDASAQQWGDANGAGRDGARRGGHSPSDFFETETSQ